MYIEPSVFGVQCAAHNIPHAHTTPETTPRRCCLPHNGNKRTLSVAKWTAKLVYSTRWAYVHTIYVCRIHTQYQVPVPVPVPVPKVHT